MVCHVWGTAQIDPVADAPMPSASGFWILIRVAIMTLPCCQIKSVETKEMCVHTTLARVVLCILLVVREYDTYY